jgi:DNA-binding IclR family transcriptional regulator
MQLSIRLSIPKSSLYAMLRTMVDRGWLQIDANGSVYQLGLHSLVVRSVYLDGDPALARASSVLDEVAAATRETIHLGRPDGAEVIYTAKRESIHPLTHVLRGRAPSAGVRDVLGRALLAKMPAEARREMTSKTTAHKDAVLEIIDRAAYQGYANESEESCMGVRCSASRSPSTTRRRGAQRRRAAQPPR